MDVINFAGRINFALIAGIIGILFTVKRLDTKKRIGKKAYIVAVVILGFVAGAIASGSFLWNDIIVNGIIHAGAASIVYQTGKMVIPSEDNFFNKAKEKKKKGKKK